MDAKFFPPVEQLAFSIITQGEADFKEVSAPPLPEAIKVLIESKNYQDVADNLPDKSLN